MPYNSDKIIFVDTTASPREGISIADIQAVLGSSANDIGQLIRNGLINKWAKYKPVKKAGLDFPNERNADFTWKTAADTGGPATWWKAYNGQCGLTFTISESLYTGNSPFAAGSFLRKLKDWDSSMVWGYERPSGGINQYPYRFFDFNYYSHNAPKPVSGVFDNLRLIPNGGNTYNLTIQLDENRAQSDLGIQLSDLVISQSAASGRYVGVLIYKSDSLFSFAFSENTLGGVGELSVHFPTLSGSFAGNATVVPFLSSVRSNQGENPGAGIFLSCDAEPQSVTIQAASQGVTLDMFAEFGRGYGYVKYTVNIINYLTTTQTVNNLKIRLYDGSQYLYTRNVGTVQIAPNTSASFSSDRAEWSIVYDPTKTYKVIVESSYSTVNGEEEVNAPRDPNLL